MVIESHTCGFNHCREVHGFLILRLIKHHLGPNILDLTGNFEITRTFINIKYKFEHMTYITQIIEKKYYFFSFGCDLKQETTRIGKKKKKGGIHGKKKKEDRMGIGISH